ncbi:hypothetical protein ANN_06291 [Periplaneta americana]|uniref:Histone-lysine N-methyltransferase SETMAR n=1 Tax=Periplaneta americana TaxID=6978 RepID=A0ABQ8TEW6_PERAM|nr:hypothetical protein ANN_06291 [Periplaneta americana]
MDLREVGYDDRKWINLAQDRDRWRTYTINAVRYVQTVLKLRRALCVKRPGKKIALQHDNAWPHTDHVTVEKIGTFGWETLPLSPYSPDLAQSDYHLLGSVKGSCGANATKR